MPTPREGREQVSLLQSSPSTNHYSRELSWVCREVVWTRRLCWHLCRKRITGNANSQGLRSHRESSTLSLNSLGQYASIVDFCFLVYKMGLIMTTHTGLVRIKGGKYAMVTSSSPTQCDTSITAVYSISLKGTSNLSITQAKTQAPPTFQ